MHMNKEKIIIVTLDQVEKKYIYYWAMQSVK